MKKILYIALAAALAAGCSKEKENTDFAQGGEVHFSARVESRAVDNAWETDDRVGIFAYDATNAVKSNAQYKITDALGGTMDAASDADNIYYPTGKSLSFYAYYPFTSDQEKIIGATYKIDATDQSTAEKTKALDLMWAKAENQSTTNVALQFAHKMVKLHFDIKVGGTEVNDLKGLTATLQGANATANFDLKTGEFSGAETADIALTVAVDAEDNTVATVSAFVAPTTDLSSVQVLFRTLDGKAFAWKPATKKWTDGKDYIYTVWIGKIVPFSDPNFVAYLRDVKGILVTDDGTIDPTNETNAAALSGITYMDVSNKEIFSLAGIEYMPKLASLKCFSNPLASLDVSKNTELTRLECYNNALTRLDVSKNTELTSLVCSSNSLKSLDVSHNTKLTHLNFYTNSLTSIDLSKNTELTNLSCGINPLKNFDVSQNTKLTYLSCEYDSLLSLDVSKNTELTYLDCSYNSLTSLDVSKNTKLTILRSSANPLKSLDVSKNTELADWSCGGNSLTSIDVSKNTKLTNLYCNTNSLTNLDVSQNTKLTILYCNTNSLTSLDITKLSSLSTCFCSGQKTSDTGKSITLNLTLTSAQKESITKNDWSTGVNFNAQN